eukprot:1379116-Amphidinium_carterae.1
MHLELTTAKPVDIWIKAGVAAFLALKTVQDNKQYFKQKASRNNDVVSSSRPNSGQDVSASSAGKSEAFNSDHLPLS